jgi:iron complex transport system substrate-binding protein
MVFAYRIGWCRRARLFGLLFVILSATVHAGTIKVTDDVGNTVMLLAPARRIVSLAPHAVELLFAAGAGAQVIATVDYSDYPPAARKIPRIGGSSGLDVERIVALKPDLIVAWASGNPRRTIEQLRSLGFVIYLTEPRHLADIARNLEQLGRLAGTEPVAREEARQFTARYRALTAQYAQRPRLRVFYQVLDPLLITVNREHLISEVLQLCGGENIFAALPLLAPAVSEEAVLAANPEVIIAGGTEEGWRPWQARWRERTELKATNRDALYFIPADRLHRHGPRVLDGVEQLCAALDDARRKR